MSANLKMLAQGTGKESRSCLPRGCVVFAALAILTGLAWFLLVSSSSA